MSRMKLLLNRGVGSCDVIFPISLQGRGARAVFQFYPEDPRQVEIVTAQAIKAGFSGGVVVDYPNSTKAKKFFLVLMTAGGQQMPAALGTEGADNQISNEQRRYLSHFFA